MRVLCQLEVYAVFHPSTPSHTRESLMQAVQQGSNEFVRHPEPNDKNLARGFSLKADSDFEDRFTMLKNKVISGELRWLECGLHGYGLFEKSREYRPWKRNRYLKLEQFKTLETLEPEVRYHAPE